jgi:hypothetical protein
MIFSFAASFRAKRKLGKLIIAAAKAGALAKGGGDQRSKHRDKKIPVKPSLAAAHVDKNLAISARWRRAAGQPRKPG